MKDRLLNSLNFLFSSLIIVTILSTLFLVLNLTTEFYETPKILALLAVLGLLIILLAVRFVVMGRVTIAKSLLDLPLFLLLIIVLISTYFSQAQGDSIYGNLPRIQGSLLSVLGLIILYFVTSSTLITFKPNLKIGFTTMITGLLFFLGAVLSIISLLYYFGIYVLPFALTKAQNFTSTGSNFTTTAFLVLLIPFALFSLLRNEKNDPILAQQESLMLNTKNRSPNKYGLRMVLSILLSLFVATIVLTGSLSSYIGSIVALLLTLVYVDSKSLKKNLPFLFLPLVTAITLVIVSYFKVPLPLTSNLYTQAQNFPREIQLDAVSSWKVSASTFRDSPFIGSGPSTFLNDFTVYKPAEFNSSKFWNIRFNTAFNEYFEDLATLGLAGVIIFMIITLLVAVAAFKVLNNKEDSNLQLSLASSGILIFVLLALHSATLPFMIVAILILVLFVNSQSSLSSDLSFGMTATKKENDQIKLSFDTLPTILLILFTILVVVAYIYIGKFATADYYHKQGLIAATANRGIDSYNNIQIAENINPNIDLYRTDMANLNFAIANALVAQKGPSESSAAGSLTDKDKQDIQTLLNQSIIEGKVAVSLNPNSASDWEVLGSIYHNISGVSQNALSLSLDAYGHAVQRDPLNPLLRLTIGGIFYGAKDYDSAIRFFTDVINLKPDYANGYYNLGIALRDKGDLANSKAALEKAMSLLDPKSDDYKTAANVLSDVTAKLDAQTKNQKAKTTTSANENGTDLNNAGAPTSALENKNLPKVLNLPKPDNISTPSAVPTP